MADIPMIGQMSITDEHKLVPFKTKMKKILDILRDNPTTAVILHDNKMKIIGVITAEDIDAAVEGGKKVKKLAPHDVMLTNILEVPSDVPVDRALEVIARDGPDAVIVRHKDGEFAGYFSVEDYHQAKDMLAQQQERTQTFNQNAQNFGGRVEDLQSQMGEEEEEEEDLSYIPAAMRDLPLSPQMKSSFKAQAEGGKKAGPPAGRPRGPPGQVTQSEPEPEPEPEPVTPAPAGPVRGGPSRPGSGPPQRPASGDVTSTAADDGAMDDVGGHLMVENTGVAGGPGDVVGTTDPQRAGPGDPIIDMDIGGTASRPNDPMGVIATDEEKNCPYCDEVIKAAAKKCRFCMEWLN